MKASRVLLLVEPSKNAMDRAFEVLKKPNKKYANMNIISFPDYETLGKVITPARLELISIIRKEKPKSIQELSRLSKRNFKNVYEDVKILNRFGLIILKETGIRKAAQPIAKFSELVLAA